MKCPTCGSSRQSRPSVVYRGAVKTGPGDQIRVEPDDDFETVAGWSMTNGIVLFSFASGGRARVRAKRKVAVRRAL